MPTNYVFLARESLHCTDYELRDKPLLQCTFRLASVRTLLPFECIPADVPRSILQRPVGFVRLHIYPFRHCITHSTVKAQRSWAHISKGRDRRAQSAVFKPPQNSPRDDSDRVCSSHECNGQSILTFSTCVHSRSPKQLSVLVEREEFKTVSGPE